MGGSQHVVRALPRALLILAVCCGALFLSMIPAHAIPPTLSVSPARATPGTHVEVRGDEHPPCDRPDVVHVDVLWDGTVTLARAPMVDGSFAVDVVVPEDAQSGQHSLSSHCAADPAPNVIRPQLAQATLDVFQTPEPVTPAPVPTPSPTSKKSPKENAPPAEVGGTRIRRPVRGVESPASISTKRPAAPRRSSAAGAADDEPPSEARTDRAPDTDAHADRALIPASLTPPSRVPITAAGVAMSIAIAAVMFALLAFPAELFNQTYEEHYDEISRKIGRVSSFFSRLTTAAGRFPAPVVLAGFAVVAGALNALLDPGFSLHASSLADVIGLAIAITVTAGVLELPTFAVSARRGISGSVRAFPQAFLIAGLCVALSRMLEFQPGYLYGVILAFHPSKPLSTRDEGRAIALGSGLVLLLGIGAWVCWGAIEDVLTRPDASFGIRVADMALAGTFLAGISGILFGLLPLRFCDGHRVRRWNTKVWLGLYAASLFLFVHIVLARASTSVASSSLLRAAAVLATFATASVAFWGWFRFRRVGPVLPPPESASVEVVIRETVGSDA